MKIYFVRHLKTKGNYEKRYTGSTDESLYLSEQQNKIKLPGKIEVAFSSPMKRCIETAQIFLPRKSPIIIEDLKEIDFGIFENKTYEELKECKEYIDFIRSNGSGYIPGGEQPLDFKIRCCNAFEKIIKNIESVSAKNAAVFCHGGTIMSIMEKYEQGCKSFYDYRIENGSAYETEYHIIKKTLTIVKEISTKR